MREESFNSIASSIKEWQDSMSKQNMRTFVLLSSTAISLAIYLLVFFCIAHRNSVVYAQLAGNQETCNAEGEVIDTQAIPYLKCYDCSCKNGFVECVKQKCPALNGCHLLQDPQKGDCCRKCKGCTRNGVYHESGTEWTESKDPCKTFECVSGVITESTIQCYTPCTLTNQPQPGQCCPTCSDCRISGEEINKRIYIAPDDDPCISCECDMNKLSCAKRTCPVINCPESKVVQGFKECCPQCLGTATYLDPPGGACILGTTVHKSGTEFILDNCTHCACESSTIHCQKRSCPVLNCKQQELLAGECCPKCKSIAADNKSEFQDESEDGDESGIEREEQTEDEQTDEESVEDLIQVHKLKPTSCNYADRTYKNGESWNEAKCKNCTCVQGEVNCAPVMCPALKCPANKILKIRESQCCPVCTEDEEVCTVFGGSHFRTFDGKLFAFIGSCKYQLASDCDSGTFNVRLKNAVMGNDVAIKRISLRLDKLRIDLQQNGNTKVNDEIVELPYRLKSAGLEIKVLSDDVLVSSRLGISARWNYLGFFELKVPRSYQKKLCGLCGNFNSDPNDDLTTREHISVKDPAVFAQSWVTTDDNCLDTRKYGIRACDPDKDQRLCNYVRGSVFSKCLKRINVTSYYETCLKDMCDCPPEDLQCHCESFGTYVRDCRRLGILLPRWRKSVGC